MKPTLAFRGVWSERKVKVDEKGTYILSTVSETGETEYEHSSA